MGPDHNGEFWNSSESCDNCHSDGDPWPGPADGCTGCHITADIAASVGN
jgi:hypothetical protein